VSEEDPIVSRRQWFRGVTGDLLRAIGEVSGIDRLEERLQEARVVTDIQGYFASERQTTAIADIFGFMERMGTPEEPASDEPEPAQEAQHEPEPSAEPEPRAPVK
jgi:hypothetical protein